MKNKKNYILVGIVCSILCVYSVCQFFFPVPFGTIRSAVWDWQHRNTDQTMICITGKSTLYEEDTSRFDKYLNLDEVNFSWAEEEENYLMILGENYSRSYFNYEDVIYSNGPMGFYNGAVIVMVDSKQEKVVKEIEISPSDGKVIYMDSTKYVLIRHPKVKIYEMATGEMIKEEFIEHFVIDEMYDVEVKRLDGELKISRYGEIVYRTNIE